MRIFLKLVLVSILSTSIGLLPWILNLVIISDAPNNLKNIIQLVSLYLIGIFNGSIVVFCFGSALYLILFRFKLTNYVSVLIIGGLTLFVNNYESAWYLITLSGFIIAPLYHFYFNKYKVMEH